MTAPPLDMARLRAEIDRIDRDLARLIAERSSLASAVAAAKRAGGDSGFGWRPAREVEILRAVRVAAPDLDPALAATVWRAMIASNLAAQGGLDVVTVADAAVAAHMAFGAASEARVVAHAAAALTAAREGRATVAVLPAPGRGGVESMAWWALMRAPGFDGLHVCAASPPVGGGHPLEGFVVARRLPEAAGGDISLLAGPAQALSRFGGACIDRSTGLELHAVEGFIDPAEPPGPSLRLIGSYALA